MAFNDSLINKISKRYSEPAALLDGRLNAFKRHNALEWPDKSDLIWKHVDVSLLDPLQGYDLYDDNAIMQSFSLSDADSMRFLNPIEGESLVLLANNSLVKQELASGILAKGISGASVENPGFFGQFLDAGHLSEAEQKLVSLNEAFHDDGIFLSVPEGQEINKPIRLVRLLSSRPGAAYFPLTVLSVGKNSRLTVLDECYGVGESSSPASSLVNGRVELWLEAGAELNYVRIQKWHENTKEFILQRASIGEGSRLSLTNVTLGGEISKTHLITRLAGIGASSNLYGFAFGQRMQQFDQYTLQAHEAPRTTSDLLYKAALKDKSRMSYAGLIRIAKGAQQSDAYQSNNNLMLDDEAKAETVPMLEILADDVHCKHGATVGPVDEDQLFYLMTRGVERRFAERMLVMGFVEPVLAQVHFAPISEMLRSEIESGLIGQTYL